MQFRLEISLGNEAMSTPYQVADALRQVAETFRQRQPTNYIATPDERSIFDYNGNKVGKWSVTE